MKIDKEAGEKDKKKKKSPKTAPSNNVNEGLRKVVKELLVGYTPRSSEHLPFYCRVCSVQSENLETFVSHKKTEFHKIAVQEEKKASFCKLCRKQFTSICQMQEHLKSRPHKEKLNRVREKQFKRSIFH